MKKLALCLLALIPLVVTSCSHFRINMRKGYTADYPASPTPPSPEKAWVDVKNWQHFLVTHGYLTGSYRTNEFDDATRLATKKFQAAQLPGSMPLPTPGVVNWATYHKARRAGMPKYPPVVTAPEPRKYHRHP